MCSSKHIVFQFLFLASFLLVIQGQRGAKLTEGFKHINGTTKNLREGKLFSLFSIVQFTNGVCQSTSTMSSAGTGSTNRVGTCYTSTECTNNQGKAAGSCAAGFGVCCVFMVSSMDTASGAVAGAGTGAASGASANQNCTYIRNPNFPSPYGSTNQIGYTIGKSDSSVCQLRLDFETFTIQGTGNTDETDTTLGVAGGVCLDMFTVTTNTGSSFPIICGQNTGQHMYIDLGCESSGSATLKFDFDATDTTRLWEIMVTHLECYTEGHPTGSGCLQYHTGHCGRFTSFNFLPANDNHLANQEYAICIRQEEGMCCIEYTPCADINSYSFDAMAQADAISRVDTDCATFDYIGIEGVQATCSTSSGNIQHSRLCGQKFNVLAGEMLSAASLFDCTKPFQVDIFFNDNNESGNSTTAAVAHSRGVCLEYRQVPC